MDWCKWEVLVLMALVKRRCNTVPTGKVPVAALSTRTAERTGTVTEGISG
jgi:hypothetical protein